MTTQACLRRAALSVGLALGTFHTLGTALAAGPQLQLQPVGDALQRPALAVRQPARAVLLAVARAGERLVAVGERGLVVLSDDAGISWRQVATPVSVTLTSLRFADAQHGAAVGHGATVMTTADGGQQWTVRLDGRRAAQLALDAAKATGDAARMKDAERLVADGPDKPLLDVAIWDARRMLVVGAYGIAFQTLDGGQTWQPWSDRLLNPKALHLYTLRRQGPVLIAAGEQGLLLRSDNDGESFKPLTSPYRGSWFSAEVLASGDVVLGGLRGNAWRSADGGASWSQLNMPVAAAITAMAQAADGSLLLASQAGQVLRLDGNRLLPVSTTALRPLAGLAGLAFAPDGKLLAVGLGGAAAVPVSR